MVRAVDKSGRSALHCTSFFGQNPLHFAAANRGPKQCVVVSELLRGSKEQPPKKLLNLTDGKGRTPLHIATAAGYPQMVETKREYVRKADILGQTALLTALRQGHKETIEKLLHNGSHPLKTSLHFAVQREGDLVAVEGKRYKYTYRRSQTVNSLH